MKNAVYFPAPLRAGDYRRALKNASPCRLRKIASMLIAELEARDAFLLSELGVQVSVFTLAEIF